MTRMRALTRFIRDIPDFPKQGIVYWDFASLLANPGAVHNAIADFIAHFKDKVVTKVAAIEAKGFTIGAILAYEMHVPLMLIRKPGLVPGNVLSESFVKEYGDGMYQIKAEAIKPRDKVLIVYDIMAGSGASRAAIQLVERSGAEVVGCAYVIELAYLNGREGLQGHDLFSLVRINHAKGS